MMKSILLRILILAGILFVPSYFIYKDYLSNKGVQQVKVVSEKNTEKMSDILSVEDIKVGPISNPKMVNLASPDLNKKWGFPSDFPPEVKRIMELRISETTDSLRKDLDQYDKWIELATLRKNVGDYNEARNILEYSSKKWPDSIISYHNLADLYASYLKEYNKAEKNMLKVIELDPRYVSEYTSLHDLYRRLYGENDKRTEGILTRALANNSQSVDLMVLLAHHHKEINDVFNAKKYYKMALGRARELANLSLQKTIEVELQEYLVEEQR